MGFTKRSLEMHADDLTKVDAVKILYQHDYISDDPCRGIARQIMGQGTICRLSKNQKYHYQKEIEPLIKTEIKYCCWCSNIILKDWSVDKKDDYDRVNYWCSEDCFRESSERSF